MVQGLDNGFFPELPSLWSSWSMQVADMSLNDADAWFASLIKGVVQTNEDPMPIARFNAEIDNAHSKASVFYHDLLRDFDVRPRVTDLNKRMGAHLDRVVERYHEHVQGWVGDVITKTKADLDVYLSTLVLPLDPSVLEASGEQWTGRAVASFDVD